MSRPKARLLLADDHEDVRREIRDLLASDFDVVGTVGDGLALVEAAHKLQPDVVVSDIRMPQLSGIEASRKILMLELCKVIVLLTMYDDSKLVKKALEAGVRGYVLKVNAGEELIPAVHLALDGSVFVSPEIRPGQDV